MKKSIGAKTILFPAPVLVVGSYDRAGKANGVTAAWGGICNSVPPCLMVSLRESRYSLECIKERKVFTVNVPSEKHVAEADYFGMVSGRKRDKFADTGLKYEKAPHIDAPLITSFPLVIECRLANIFELGSHLELVGEIVDISVDEELLSEDGLPDPELMRPLVFAPVVRKYYGLGTFLGDAFSVGKRFMK